MTEESLEVKVAKLEGRVDRAEDDIGKIDVTLNGEPGGDKKGLIDEFRRLRTENRYLRVIYILATALALPIINGIITKMGFGPIKIGGEG